MIYIPRKIQKEIERAITRNKSVLLLGPRQTGKTTLIQQIENDLYISLIHPNTRLRYEKSPGILSGEVAAIQTKSQQKRPLILLDEIQKVPKLLDVVQDLIDRNIANFILTGSSARKIKHHSEMNLLPGRVVFLRLDPLLYKEKPQTSLEDRLLYGSLPGIENTEKSEDKEIDLESYVSTYLDQEIRSEAIVRNLGSFAKFLEYAAMESGNIINFSKLSQEIGIASGTIASYYQILEDCMIIDRVQPISSSHTRKRLTKTPRYLFFDLGVRRLAAEEGTRLPKETMGHLFEHFVGLELIKLSRHTHPKTKIRFWRSPNGPEVDWIVEKSDEYIPIEVKWTDSPQKKDARHLKVFLSEYAKAKTGYIICQCPRKIKIQKNITALPWQEIPSLYEP